MDPEKEKRMLQIQMRLNAARAANNKAAANEISRSHGLSAEKKSKKIDTFDIPMSALGSSKTSGATSEDHLKDNDVQKYLKQVKKIPRNVYSDYNQRKKDGTDVMLPKDYADPELLEKMKNDLIRNVQKTRERNVRAGNYDITGKTSVDFINDKNRRFNRKLAKAYDEYTEETRLNLERGGSV